MTLSASSLHSCCIHVSTKTQLTLEPTDRTGFYLSVGLDFFLCNRLNLLLQYFYDVHSAFSPYLMTSFVIETSVIFEIPREAAR